MASLRPAGLVTTPHFKEPSCPDPHRRALPRAGRHTARRDRAQDPRRALAVVDASDTDVAHVETLTGFDDRLSQGEALTCDHANEMHAYHDGERLEDPLPRLRPDPPAEPACAT